MKIVIDTSKIQHASLRIAVNCPMKWSGVSMAEDSELVDISWSDSPGDRTLWSTDTAPKNRPSLPSGISVKE